MWFNKVKITKEPYEYYISVPFEVAFKALKEGYIVKHANHSDVYLKYFNGRMYEILDRDGDNCFEVDEFSVFDMMIDGWIILPPNTVRSKM